MSWTYEKLQRIARAVAAHRGKKPYAAVAVRFGAELEQLCEQGLLSPEERASLWRLVDPDAKTAPDPSLALQADEGSTVILPATTRQRGV